MKNYSLLPILILLLAGGCKKDSAVTNCTGLSDAAFSDNVPAAGAIINSFIQSLPSKKNTSVNLNNLANYIAAHCSVSAKVRCFGCIYTLPEQSEIEIRFTSSAGTGTKVIDISYSPDNNMKFVNMHD